MRTYVVKEGDTPAKIAIAFAECPKCAVDLIRANRKRKAVVAYPNGFVTFKELRVGEAIELPDKWFGPRVELLPPAYYGSLPYADGVTPSPFGELASVILRDFFALDAADELLLESENERAATLIGETMQRVVAAPMHDAAERALYALACLEHGDLLPALLAAQYALQAQYSTIKPPEKRT